MGGFNTDRDRAASVAVGGTMVVLGGRGQDGEEMVGFEMFDVETEQWVEKPEWRMEFGRYRFGHSFCKEKLAIATSIRGTFSFCSVPLNATAMVIIGGYSAKGAVSSVNVLDTATGRWEKLPDLPKARYGHACLLMEWKGVDGVLVSGGALTGTRVDFYDIKSNKCVEIKVPVCCTTLLYDFVSGGCNSPPCRTAPTATRWSSWRESPPCSAGSAWCASTAPTGSRPPTAKRRTRRGCG